MQNAAFVSWVNSNDWHLMVRAPRDHQKYLWNVFRRNLTKMSSTVAKNKWSSLQTHFNSGEHILFLSSESSPEYCVRLLKYPSVQNYYGMRGKLMCSSNGWMAEFLENDGMEVLLGALERLSSRKLFVDAVMLLECTCCIKTVLNSKAGLEFMIGNRDFTRRLGRG